MNTYININYVINIILITLFFNNCNEIKIQKKIYSLPDKLIGRYIDPFSKSIKIVNNFCNHKNLEIDYNIIIAYCDNELLSFCPIKNIIKEDHNYYIKCDKLSIGGKYKLPIKNVSSVSKIPNSFVLTDVSINTISIKKDLSNSINGKYTFSLGN